MKLAIFTSTSLRHLYFCEQISRYLKPELVVLEKKQYKPDEVYRNAEEESILKNWFSGRTDVEERFFQEGAQAFKSRRSLHIVEVEAGDINSPQVIEELDRLEIDFAVVFGSSIIKEPIINLLKEKLLNMHLGLSPYYRGSGTNFWPFYYKEIEYVGVTIHWLNAGIDSGKIIHQRRPQISLEDDPHTIGCKTIVEGTKAVIQAMQEYTNGVITAFDQDLTKGKLFLRKNFNADHIKVVNKHLAEGLIENYVQSPREVEIIP